MSSNQSILMLSSGLDLSHAYNLCLTKGHASHRVCGVSGTRCICLGWDIVSTLVHYVAGRNN